MLLHYITKKCYYLEKVSQMFLKVMGMKMNYLKIEIVLLKNIGDIDATREKIISDLLKDKYPNKITIPQIGVAFAQRNQNEGLILVANQQISYQNQLPCQDGAGADVQIARDMSLITERLAISEIGKYVINAEFIINVDFDSMRDSIVKNKPFVDYEEFGIKGSAIKYFVNDESIEGMYTFEPYIKDISNYFVSYNIQSKKDLKTFAEALRLFRDYKNTYERMTKKILKVEK